MTINKDDVSRVVGFYAYSSTDHITPKDGLLSFTVYYFLNGGSATAMTTPTVVEKDATNMKGWYTVAVDESGMVSALGDVNINIAATGMDPVALKIEIVDVNPAVDTVKISGDTTAADNLELDYDGTGYARANSIIGTCTTNTDMVGTAGAALATVCTEGRLSNLNATISSRSPVNEYDTEMGYIPSNLGDVPIASELNSDHGAGSWVTATGFNTVTPDAAGTAAGLHSTTDGKVDTAQTDLNILTGVDGVTLATLQANYAPNTVVPDAAGVAATPAEVATALTDYDAPTRAEATTDKEEILTEVNANETKIDILDGNVDSILIDTNTTIPALINGLDDITVADIKAGIKDGAFDLEEMARLIFAACCAKSSGGGTDTITFRDGPDTKNRIVETVDDNGNRTAVTLDGTS